MLNQQGQKEYEIEPPRDLNFINEKVIELNNSIFTNMNYKEYSTKPESHAKRLLRRKYTSMPNATCSVLLYRPCLFEY